MNHPLRLLRVRLLRADRTSNLCGATALASLATLSIGCAGGGAATAPPVSPAGVGAAATETAEHRDAFLEAEGAALDTLAASDPRFAHRLGVTPSDASVQKAAVQALLSEDKDARVHEGSLDFFSFASRTRALDAASAKVAQNPAPPSLALEQLLWNRSIAAEHARLADESSLPRGASTLVRGMIETWNDGRAGAASATKNPTNGATKIESDEAVAQRDAWGAARLADVTESLKRDAPSGSTLSRMELDELEDSLDPLEHLAAPEAYPKTAGNIARLRIALGEVKAAPKVDEDWTRIRDLLRAEVGGPSELAEVERALAGADAALRARIKKVDPKHALDDRAVAHEAERLAFAPDDCEHPAGSRVRAMLPPTERGAVCGMLRTIARANDDASRLVALEVMEFEVAAASWALAVHGHGTVPERAQETRSSVLRFSPEREAPFVRLAIARPVTALAAGLAVAQVIAEAAPKDGTPALDDVTPRARAWLTFGDAPLDVVKSHALSTNGTADAATVP